MSSEEQATHGSSPFSILPHTAVRGNAIYINGDNIRSYNMATFTTEEGSGFAVYPEPLSDCTLKVIVPELAIDGEVTMSGPDVTPYVVGSIILGNEVSSDRSTEGRSIRNIGPFSILPRRAARGETIHLNGDNIGGFRSVYFSDGNGDSIYVQLPEMPPGTSTLEVVVPENAARERIILWRGSQDQAILEPITFIAPS
jgi:hypothetical protein